MHLRCVCAWTMSLIDGCTAGGFSQAPTTTPQPPPLEPCCGVVRVASDFSRCLSTRTHTRMRVCVCAEMPALKFIIHTELLFFSTLPTLCRLHCAAFSSETRCRCFFHVHMLSLWRMAKNACHLCVLSVLVSSCPVASHFICHAIWIWSASISSPVLRGVFQNACFCYNL